MLFSDELNVQQFSSQAQLEKDMMADVPFQLGNSLQARCYGVSGTAALYSLSPKAAINGSRCIHLLRETLKPHMNVHRFLP